MSEEEKKQPITAEQYESVCKLIESSKGNIPDKCKQVGIGTESFYIYKSSSEEAEKRYARAKELQATPIFNECLEIADEPLPMTEHGLDSAAVADKRVRIDTRKWYLSKLAPDKYSDHVDITSKNKQLGSNAPFEFVIYDGDKKIEEPAE